MFAHPILLGSLGFLLGAGLVARRHRWAHRHGGWHHHGRFGGRGLFFALRSLGLDHSQRRELWGIARELREVFGRVRFGGFEGIDTLVEAMTSAEFDRAAVEAAADKQAQSVAELRGKIVQAAERVHATLTPEQRQRLREMIFGGPSRFGAGGPDGGPYRTAL